MKIKFIYPPIADMLYNVRKVDIPYGLGVLTSFLRKNGVSVELEDLNARLNSLYSNIRSKKILREIFQFYQHQKYAGHYTGISDRRNDTLADTLLNKVDLNGCNVVGIGVTSGDQLFSALLLAEKIGKEYKIPVTFGGAHITLVADALFRKYHFIDYAIVGEGEMPLLKLIRYMQGKGTIQNIPSLWYRNRERILFNGRIFYNIEDQSCPDFDDLKLELYKAHTKIKPLDQRDFLIPYSTSRGCLHKCSFCDFHLVDGPWQTKSVGKVIKDIALLKRKYKSKLFDFHDPAFNQSYKRTENLCEEFLKRKVNIRWRARVRGSCCDKKLLFKMKQGGCYLLTWGVESGSSRILEMMKKDADIKQQAAMLKIAKEMGVKNIITLIIKYPYETADDLRKTALFIKKNAKLLWWVQIYRLVINPGSFLFNNAEALKIKIKENQLSCLSYHYDYEENERSISKNQEETLKRLRKRIFKYAYRDIHYKHFRFPHNILARFFMGRKG